MKLKAIMSIMALCAMPMCAQVKYDPQPVSHDVRAKLDQAVGNSVYTCARSGFMLLSDHDSNGNKGLYYGAAATPRFIPVMTAMKIVGIEKVGDIGSRYLMGIRFENMVLPAIVVDPADLISSTSPVETIASAAGLFTSRRASGIKFSDLDAVVSGQIHAGMSEEEAECALGPSDRSNDDSAGTQNIYADGRLIVYVANGKVTNVQHSSE